MTDPGDLLAPDFLTRLERLDVIARKVMSGEMRGDALARRRGIGALFRDHARYTQGDDLRFVDWNAYSRLGELLVKQFESEENLSLDIVLDATGSMDVGTHRKFRLSKQVAAAVAYVALRRHARVRIHLFPGDGSLGGRTFFGRARIHEMLSALQNVEAGGAASLEDAVARLEQRRGRGVALVISDFFLESGFERALGMLVHGGYRVAAVHVLDAADLDPEVEGLVKLVDVETDRSRRGFVSAALIKRYREEVRVWCRGVETFCRRHDISYTRVDTAWRLEKAVNALLLGGSVLR